MNKIVKRIQAAANASKDNKSRVNWRKQNQILIAQERETISLGEWALLFMLLLFLIAPSCSSVKSYEKMYLNDAEMALDAQKIEKFELSFQTYREGASGATGGKSGGGCGCN